MEFSERNVSSKNIEKAVRDTGMSMRYTRLTVRGKLDSLDGRDAHKVTGSDELYIFEKSDKLGKLKSAINGKGSVLKLIGLVEVEKKKAEGQSSRYKLIIEGFEVESWVDCFIRCIIKIKYARVG